MQYCRYRKSKNYIQRKNRKARIIHDIKALKDMFDNVKSPIEQMMDFLNEELVNSARIIKS